MSASLKPLGRSVMKVSATGRPEARRTGMA
jgi:hypothetical protein